MGRVGEGQGRGRRRGGGRTFPPYTLVKFSGEFGLVGVGLEVVDVDVEAAADAVCDGVDEFVVGGAFGCGGRVDEAFAVFGVLAG